MTTLLLQTATELLFQTFVLFLLIVFWILSRSATLYLLWQVKDRVLTVANAFYQLDRLIQSINGVADALNQEAEPPVAHTFTVVILETLQTFEGANLSMNIVNTGKAGLTANFKNKFKGPARHEAGTVKWEAIAPTGAFRIVVDPNNELRVLLLANPQSPGGPEDLGLVRCTADGAQGEAVNILTLEMAVNVTPADAFIGEIQAGAVEEQAEGEFEPPVGGGEEPPVGGGEEPPVGGGEEPPVGGGEEQPPVGGGEAGGNEGTGSGTV